jgi:hypothetical protein
MERITWTIKKSGIKHDGHDTIIIPIVPSVKLPKHWSHYLRGALDYRMGITTEEFGICFGCGSLLGEVHLHVPYLAKPEHVSKCLESLNTKLADFIQSATVKEVEEEKTKSSRDKERIALLKAAVITMKNKL